MAAIYNVEVDAGMLACPQCGAPVAHDALACQYCRAELQTEPCAGCYGLNFVGSKHCAHCGAKIFRGAVPATAERARPCPRCGQGMTLGAVGEAFVESCAGCGGAWVDLESLRAIVARKQSAAAYLGGPPPGQPVGPNPVAYVKCPDCGKLMNRMNFGRYSGVIVDVCKIHGTWFDDDELRRVVEFVGKGGLDAAREKELEQLKLEKERLQAKLHAGEGAVVDTGGHSSPGLDLAGDLLRLLLG